MGRHSQRKGSRFESLVAKIISSALDSWAVRNMHQTKGEDTGRDLWTNLPFCIQCCHAKHPPIYQKLGEAVKSARPGEMPVAVIRQDRKDIIVVMRMDDWLELVKQALPWVES